MMAPGGMNPDNQLLPLTQLAANNNVETIFISGVQPRLPKTVAEGIIHMKVEDIGKKFRPLFKRCKEFPRKNVASNRAFVKHSRKYVETIKTRKEGGFCESCEVFYQSA